MGNFYQGERLGTYEVRTCYLSLSLSTILILNIVKIIQTFAFAGHLHWSVFVFNMLQAVGESSDGRSVYKQQGGDNFLFYLVKHLQIVNGHFYIFGR